MHNKIAMKKIILFSLIFQCLFSLISLLLIMIKVGYGTELFAYSFYSNLIYFLIGFISNILLIRLLSYVNVNKKTIYVILFLGLIFIFNIYVYTNSGVIFSVGLFRTNIDDGWFINFFYHLSFFLSVVIMYFLSKKGRLNVL